MIQNIKLLVEEGSWCVGALQGIRFNIVYRFAYYRVYYTVLIVQVFYFNSKCNRRDLALKNLTLTKKKNQSFEPFRFVARRSMENENFCNLDNM